MPHGVEERPAIGKSSIFMDEILTAEDGPHGRSFEVVKGRHEEWRIKGLCKELKAEVMVAGFNFLLSNSSRVLPRSEDEGKNKNLTKQLKKIKDQKMLYT
ncbi:uncharacterized protein [Triticum aestivum]|uniref:uncharacterized protein isoform X4 n=1 Tax=Triticum aestivum TaxID=4565 RepID=UPI001D02F084|nr:uncharacterized protein LOC123137259 isoform X4 [Triticum aestivum]